MLSIFYYFSKLLQNQLKVPYNRSTKSPVSHSQGSLVSPELSQNLILQRSSAELSLENKREPWCPPSNAATEHWISSPVWHCSSCLQKIFKMPLTSRYPEISMLLQKGTTQRHFHSATTRVPLANFLRAPCLSKALVLPEALCRIDSGLSTLEPTTTSPLHSPREPARS